MAAPPGQKAVLCSGRGCVGHKGRVLLEEEIVRGQPAGQDILGDALGLSAALAILTQASPQRGHWHDSPPKEIRRKTAPSPNKHTDVLHLPQASFPGSGNLFLQPSSRTPALQGWPVLLQEKEPGMACGGEVGLEETPLPSVTPSSGPPLGESVWASPLAVIRFRVRSWQATRCPG